MGEYPGLTSVEKHLSSQAKQELSPSSCPWAFLKQTCFILLFPKVPFCSISSMDINTGHRPRDLVPQLDTPETPSPSLALTSDCKLCWHQYQKAQPTNLGLRPLRHFPS